MPPSQEVSVSVSGAGAEALRANPAVFKALTRAKVLDAPVGGASILQVVPELELTLPLTGLVDIGEWRTRQEKRLKELRANRDKSAKKLANAKFVQNAPAEVVEEESAG